MPDGHPPDLDESIPREGGPAPWRQRAGHADLAGERGHRATPFNPSSAQITPPDEYTYLWTLWQGGPVLGGNIVSWPLRAAPAGPFPAGTGSIADPFNGMCMALAADGTTVVAWKCNPGPSSQRWTGYNDGTLRVNGKCLDVTGPKAGATVKAAACSGAATQTWAIGQVSGNDFGSITNTATGNVLTDPASSTVNGSQTRHGTQPRRPQTPGASPTTTTWPSDHPARMPVQAPARACPGRSPARRTGGKGTACQTGHPEPKRATRNRAFCACFSGVLPRLGRSAYSATWRMSYRSERTSGRHTPVHSLVVHATSTVRTVSSCRVGRLVAWPPVSHPASDTRVSFVCGRAGVFERLLPPPLGLADQRAPRVAAGGGCRRGRGREVPHWQEAPRPANPGRPAASSTAGVLPAGEGWTAPYGVMACLPRPRHRGAGREGPARFREAASRNRTRSPRRNR